MRQKVTLGYFERDEAGRMQSRSREVVVEAASGDDAAAKALAEHGSALPPPARGGGLNILESRSLPRRRARKCAIEIFPAPSPCGRG
jgi:hypothetical protein